MAANMHPVVIVDALEAVGIYIPPHIVYSWIAMAVLILLGWLGTRNLSLVPGGVQNFFETVIGGLEDFVVSNMGEPGRKVFPVLATLFIYILVCNLMGLIPGTDASTANINNNAAMAVFVFFYYNYWGIKIHGFKYIKHFMGPVILLAPLMFVIEIISHLSRPLSLAVRLFGNIKGEELVLLLLFFLLPVISTLPIYFLFILVKFIQAFIFFMLSMVYLKGAFEEAH
jgi:F-type H+-transporting ATPase subunit a